MFQMTLSQVCLRTQSSELKGHNAELVGSIVLKIKMTKSLEG